MTTEQKSNIQLSILIPSIPSRFEKVQKLYTHLLKLVGELPIEICLLMDNKVMTIGEKHNALMDSCRGKYFMFIHDDDWLISVKEIYESTFSDHDVIDFKARCRNADGSYFIVTQQLGNAIEHNTDGERYLDCKRPPFPNCAWAAKFKRFRFPSISYGEDWVWVEQCLAESTKECYINKVLFRYDFDIKVTEASTEDNKHWVNPNGKRCVVNLSTEKYWRGQERLKERIPNYEVLTFRSEEEVGAPPHSENNYAFKVYSFIRAYELGYRQILWLDASMFPIKDLKPIFDIIDKDGYFFQDSEWTNSRWTNDVAKEYFETNDGQMMSAGVLGLDLNNPLAYQFFDQWTQSMRDGIFNGLHDNHRHDQTCASLIAHKLGMKLQEGNTFFVYGKEDNPTISDKTVLLVDGIC